MCEGVLLPTVTWVASFHMLDDMFCLNTHTTVIHMQYITYWMSLRL